MNQNLIIRADASIQIGTDHLMRCLAIADGLCEYVISKRRVTCFQNCILDKRD